jgi:hypothetical protein
MGGLVARSACHFGAEAGHAWPSRLRRLVCLGTPHRGAPLERGGRWLELVLGASPYTAPIGRLGMLRSAGITDLRHGRVCDGEPAPVPAGVECFALAGSRDALVPVASAHALHGAERWLGPGLGHFDLLDAAVVYARLVAIMTPGAPPPDRRTRAGA